MGFLVLKGRGNTYVKKQFQKVSAKEMTSPSGVAGVGSGSGVPRTGESDQSGEWRPIRSGVWYKTSGGKGHINEKRLMIM